MSVGDLPPDPWAEPDGTVDPLVSGVQTYDALALIALTGSFAEFFAAMDGLDEEQVRWALIGSLFRLARGVHEQREQRPQGWRLRRALAAALRAGKREWSR